MKLVPGGYGVLDQASLADPAEPPGKIGDICLGGGSAQKGK